MEMKAFTVYPQNDEKFWLIQLWLHIHCLIDDHIEKMVQESWQEKTPVRASDITGVLQLFFPGQELWFTGGELLQVWQYERVHPEIGENCEDYMEIQNIMRILP